MLEPQMIPIGARYEFLVGDPAVNDLTHFEQLHPQEKALVAHSVNARKAEFGDARYCAHKALKALGRDAGKPILRAERGAPLWPAAVTGSLTHTAGFRAAIVAPRLLVKSIGIDAEPAAPLDEDIIDSIALPKEQKQFDLLRAQGMPYPDRLLFCAKEATYKAWFPLTQRWLGFEQAEIELKMDGTFTSYLLVTSTPVPFIQGHWVMKDGYIVALTKV